MQSGWLALMIAPYIPVGHFLHSTWPISAVQNPTGQMSHVVALSTVENLPKLHNRQEDPITMDPGGHASRHSTEWPEKLYWPSAQSLQAVLSAALENCPASHKSHDEVDAR